MTNLLACLGCLLGTAGASRAAEGADYLKDVKPLLKGRCYSCHGALQQKARLRLDSGELIHKGGRSGPAVVPGKSGESPLVEAITGNGRRRMPPESEGAPLSDAQVRQLRSWIDQGARTPPGEQPEEDPRKHWAFQKPVRPPPPRVRNAAWGRNPVDALVAAEHEKRSLTPNPPTEDGVEHEIPCTIES